ncbi:M15 family metallopeptidase [Pedobacter endophyticus]|uniref:M15 family metallopeptidase n=1 Tax=Pedobacter endophyticus TaxID=2789740 RepID=A0A7S9L1S1_9SPHI|nr:M15 family metallopeptidase [Pedobacter endophyticus]QPH40914.1 M15 family metallopeptidase [Pedobacter endophyticus]
MGLAVIRMGSKGSQVEDWQYFLRGKNIYWDIVDGKYGLNTFKATCTFQSLHGLSPDGVVGDKTYGAAMMEGFGVTSDPVTDKQTLNWPAKPNFSPLKTDDQKQQLFGPFSFVHHPLPGDPEHIEIQGDWQKKNIIKVPIPQMKVFGGSQMWFHHLAAKQVQKMWSDWEQAGLLHLVLTWGGSFNPRFIRGSRTTLSNHAFGTAFDINVAWNGLKEVPALVGRKGSVRELVGLANDNGFYWGGHFSRQDGMHFEIAKLHGS